MVSGTEGRLELLGPEPGTWYLVSGFRTIHHHPGDGEDRCRPVLSVMAEYVIETDLITIIPTFYNYQDIRTFYTVNTTQTFKFFVPPGASSGRVDITKCSLRVNNPNVARRSDNCPLIISETSTSIPSSRNINNVTVSSVDCSVLPLSACSLGFDAQENSNHYVTVAVASNNSDTVQFAISVDLQGCQISHASAGALLVNSINTSLLCGEPNLRPVKVLFQSYTSEEGSIRQCGDVVSVMLARRRDMVGGTQFVRTGNISMTSPLKLTSSRTTVLQFTTDLTDSGGSLAVEVAILRSGGGAGGVAVSGCLSRGYRSVPHGHKCKHGRLIHQTSKPGPGSTVYEQILVLYPPPGTWYLSLSVSQCSDPGGRCNVPVLFSVHTNQCFSGVCGRYGHCYSYLSSVFYSACSCFAGHRGPACNDPSLAVSDYQLLISSLLLTTSNLAMLPAIMLAAYRGHYAECIVFTSHLIASCLYHACAEEVYSVCLISVTVLQWADIFTTVLTIWVTLVTMARLPVTIRSVVNMLAVILISVLVHHTPNVTVTLVLPSLVGVLVLVICWTWSCVTTGQCSLTTRYCVLHCVPGVMLLAISIITSLFSYNKSAFTHVGEHIARGIAILLLLPKDKHKREREPKVQTQSKNPVYRQTEVSFKQLTDSNQSSVDDMAVIRGHGVAGGERHERRDMVDKREDSMHQL